MRFYEWDCVGINWGGNVVRPAKMLAATSDARCVPVTSAWHAVLSHQDLTFVKWMIQK